MLPVGELDRLEPVVEGAEPDRRRAHQATPAVAGARDPARAVHVDPGAENIGEAEPVRGPQFLHRAQIRGRRIVVVRESGIEGRPGSSEDRFRRDPGE